MPQALATVNTLGVISTKHYDELVPRDPWQNVKFRDDILLLAGSDPAAAAELRTMCSQDPLFYLNTFACSYSPKDSAYGTAVTPFSTYKFQDEVILDILDCINKGMDATMPKSRDMGASWMGLCAIEWCWHFRDYLSFLLVSRKEDLVDKKGFPGSLFWKIDFLHKHQPRWLLPTNRWLGDRDPLRKSLHLTNADNGSVIDGESTTGNVGVGDRRTALFIDEFGAFPVDDGYAVLRGTRDVTNCRIFNSTPRGQNAFYEVCTKTTARKLRMHWSRHPLKNLGMYQANVGTGEISLKDDYHGFVEVLGKGDRNAKQIMFPEEYPFVKDGKLRSPWYDLQCNRCVSPQEIAQELDIDFLGSDYQFFDSEMIDILKKKYCRAPSLVGDLEYDPIELTPKRFREHKDGKLFLWLELDGQGRPAKDRKFVLGTDVSAGTGASNSVSCVVDKETGEKVGVWKDSHLLPNPFAALNVALAKWFNNGFMVWDRSGPTGEVFNKVVVKHGYGHIYYRRNEKKVSRQITDEPGVFLNPATKSAIFEDYRDALGNHRYINRSAIGMDECKQYIRKPDGGIEHSAAISSQDPSGARSAHGDEVVADALASLGLDERQSSNEPQEPDLPIGSLAWRQKRKSDAESATNSDGLGSDW